MNSERPLPIPDAETEPFWAATREHRLVVQRCLACQRLRHYPRALCPECGSDSFDWHECRGTGQVYTFSIVHRAPSPAFADDVPYVVGVVQLDEGPRLFSRIVGMPPEAVAIGQRVRVRWDDHQDLALPLFEPEGA